MDNQSWGQEGVEDIRSASTKSEPNFTVFDVRSSTVRPNAIRPTDFSAYQPKSNGTLRLLGHGVWMLFAVGIFMFSWYIGPQMVERYHYAATKAKMQAQYEYSSQVLQNAPLTQVSSAYQLIAQKVSPSVVSISTEKVGIDPELMRAQEVLGEGSGVIVSCDGFILTNHHVVSNSKRIEVTLPDRRQFVGYLVGSDELTDLALIRIQANDLIAAEWGNSDELEVGSLVWAIGNPFGLKHTVTAGILSGKDRQGESSQYQEFLQTDAAVNPGNSGGPLVDSLGRVIGINTSIYGRQFLGISFAVPSVIAQYVAKELRENGRVRRGFLGVTPWYLVENDASRNRLPDMDGALVTYVDQGTPAAIAGMEPGDVIRSWGGQPIKNWRHLFRYVSMTKPDESVDVELVRDGEVKHLNIKVAEAPNLS
ncbi:MAG TPA: trypsin-like peptidase domain-containing protein [Pirellulaceae bacterium]|nr:trypsin-like peptidase domain-containing protein [Pirellulaceae bacterium]HMO93418.1 trypsin-like peptidase domain-containing protein [Pirellulaceae bacterium]HMP70458.1 trypsin-like peptidase domain-containing protein [Pirellulaceae bacterium]